MTDARPEDEVIESEKEAGRIGICIASYRRPAQLLTLLQSLDALTFEATAPAIQIFVVDNDVAESARDVCESARDWLRHPLVYHVDPRVGIPQARNACLAQALGQVEWVAFVDDDEIVDPRWLDALLEQQRRSGADVVTGPVHPRFAEPAPDWVLEGRFFAPECCADGSERRTAFTHNTLARAAALQGLDRGFDERMPFGEDTELFLRVAERGHRIVWADGARVYETLGKERLLLGAILRRGFREGVTWARIERWHLQWAAGWTALRGIARLLQGIAGAILPWPRSRADRVRALRRAAYGLGRCAGLVGAIRNPAPASSR
jgi:glycosyltransferase involved in cell wall biosynthesis